MLIEILAGLGFGFGFGGDSKLIKGVPWNLGLTDAAWSWVLKAGWVGVLLESMRPFC